MPKMKIKRFIKNKVKRKVVKYISMNDVLAVFSEYILNATRLGLDN